MKRWKRWIIRSFFIGLLLLFLGGWVASFWRFVEISYASTFLWQMRTWEGTLIFESLPSHATDSEWFGSIRKNVGSDYPYGELGFDSSKFLGIKVGHAKSYWGGPLRPGYIHYLVEVPFWIPTILSAVTLWMVWRKTRPIRDPKTAFPVELAKSNGEQDFKAN